MKRTLLTALMATALIPAAAHANTQAGVNANSQVILGQNLTATDIRNLQQALNNQGLYNGTVDGLWGPGTAGALQQFQQKNSLQVGSLDTNTLNELGVTLSASGDVNSSTDMNEGNSSTGSSDTSNGMDNTTGGSVNNSTNTGPGLVPGEVGMKGSASGSTTSSGSTQ